jgi:hypothetical protein
VVIVGVIVGDNVIRYVLFALLVLMVATVVLPT